MTIDRQFHSGLEDACGYFVDHKIQDKSGAWTNNLGSSKRKRNVENY